MAITAGTYLIYNALGSEILYPDGGSKNKAAKIAFGAYAEPDNRIYWQITVSGSTNYIKNVNSGNNGFIITNAAKTIVRQNATNTTYGRWIAEATGNTLTINGYSYPLYNLKLNADQTKLLTCGAENDILEIAEAVEDEGAAASQEFAFVPMGTYDTKNLGTCSGLTSSKNTLTFVDDATITPYWKYSKTNLKNFQLRYRYQQQDADGVWGDWTPYMTASSSMAALGWGNITGSAVKKTTGSGKKKKTYSFITSNSAIPTVVPDYPDTICTRMHVQVRARNGNTHGSITGQAGYMVYATPSLTISDASLSPSGLTLFFETNYTAEGTGITITQIQDTTTGITILKDFEYEVQDYTGSIAISSSELYDLPGSGDTIQVKATLHTTVSQVKKSVSANLTVSYESGGSLVISPAYVQTDRMTARGTVTAPTGSTFDSVECYVRVDNLDGTYTLQPATEIENNGSSATFEIPVAFGSDTKVLWVCVAGTSWVSQFSTVGGQDTNYAVWYWDKDGIPNAAILKLPLRPSENLTPEVDKFITTGRDYPAYRYGKSITRNVSRSGKILSSEIDEYCTKEAFENLALAHHAIYRDAYGHWYNVAVQDVTIEKRSGYYSVRVRQEAETV